MCKIWKRWLAMLLALVMILGNVPVAAFATETEPQIVETQPEETTLPQQSEPAVDPAVAAVQALIDGLPVQLNSEEEAQALNAALAAVGDAMAELTTQQAEALNMERYFAAVEALAAWQEDDKGMEVYATHVIPAGVPKKELVKRNDVKLKESDLVSDTSLGMDVNGSYHWVKAAANDETTSGWSSIRVNRFDGDDELDIAVGDTIHVAKKSGTLNPTYTDVVIYTIVAPTAILTAKPEAVVEFNPYSGTSIADQLDELKAEILKQLEVKLGGTSVNAAEASIQYYPWQVGKVSNKGEYSGADKLTALDAAPSEGTLYTYYSFGQRFREGDTTGQEKIHITCGGQPLDAFVTLKDGFRSEYTIQWQDPGVNYETQKNIDDAVLTQLRKLNTNCGTITATMQAGQDLAKGGTICYDVTVGETAEYKQATGTVNITATPKSEPAKLSIFWDGDGGVTFGGEFRWGENIELIAGSYDLTATPGRNPWFVESVTINGKPYGVDSLANYNSETRAWTGKDIVIESGKEYNIEVTFARRTLSVLDTWFSVNGFNTETIRASYAKCLSAGRVALACNGEEAVDDRNSTNFKVEIGIGEIFGETVYSTVANMPVATLKVEGDSRPIRVTWFGDARYPEMVGTGTAQATGESRKPASIGGLDNIGEITVTDSLDLVKTTVAAAVKTGGGEVKTEIVDGTMPTSGSPTSQIKVKVTVAENEEYTKAEMEVTVTAKLASYTVTWMNGDGNELYQESVYHGQIPSYNEEEYGTPTKQSEGGKSYTWTGWDPAISAITENTTYTAVFAQMDDLNGNGVADDQEKATVTLTVNGQNLGAAALEGTDKIKLSENNAVIFDSSEEGGNELTITVAPKAIENDTSKKNVAKVTVNGAPVEIVDGKVTVALEKNQTYTVVVTFEPLELKLKVDASISVNKYALADRVTGLKKKLVAALVGEEAAVENYRVQIKGNVTTYDLDGLNTINQGLVATLLLDDEITVIVTDRITGLSDTVTVGVTDSRKELKITINEQYKQQDETYKITIENKGEPANVQQTVKNAITITADDQPVTVEDSYITYTPNYSWPEAGGQASFTVKIKPNASSQEYSNSPEATLTLECKDLTKLYQITWNAGGGKLGEETSKTVTITEDETITAPENDPTRDYYSLNTVETWKLTEGQGVIGQKPAADATFTAQWVPNLDNNQNGKADQEETYTVVFDCQDGTDLVKHEGLAHGVETPAAPVLNTKTDDGKTYNFAGWQPTVAKTVSAPTQGNTITYTAQWTEQLVVTFVTGNDESQKVDPQTIEQGKTATKPADPEWTNHHFVGWFVSETAVEAYDFSTPVTENLTLTARWFADFNNNDINDETEAHYTIRYVPGQGLDEVTYPDVLVLTDTPAYAPKNPDKTGLIFNGWEPEVTQKVQQQEENVTEIVYTAKWLPDTNENGVDDTLETLTVMIVGAAEGDVVQIGKTTLTSDEDGIAKYVYNSKADTVLTISAIPTTEGYSIPGVMERQSKTYVKSIAGAGTAGFAYDSKFTATVSVTLAEVTGEITVTFAPAAFDVKPEGERILNYYPGMTGVKNTDVYEAIAKAPVWDENAKVTVEYLARAEGNDAVVNIADLTFSVDSTADGLIKSALKLVGLEKITIPQSATWAELSTELSEIGVGNEKTYTELIKENLTTEKLDEIVTAFNVAYNNEKGSFPAKLQAGGNAAMAKLEEIIADVQKTTKFYGAHEFGYNASTSQDMTETIRLTCSNAAMAIKEETTIILRDLRTPTQLVGSGTTLTYKDFKNTDLVKLLGLQVQTVDGAAIADQSIEILEGSLEEKSVSETPYEISFRFKGNDAYKPCEGTFQVTITKAPATMDISNVSVTYGTSYAMNHNVVPGNAYGEAKEIEDSLIRFVVGLNVADAKLNENGITGVKPTIQLMLPGFLDDLFEDGVEMSLAELVNSLPVDSESLGVLRQVLQAIIDVANAADVRIKLGGKLPEDIGTYLYGAVSTSGNYETVMDVAYIIIKPNAQQVYLDWNYSATNGVFTPELLYSTDLGASAFQEKTFENRNAEASDKIYNLFFGVNKGENNQPKLTLKFYDKTVDPAGFQNDLGNGAFTQLAFLADFGNEMYYAVPIARGFLIVPNTVKVEIRDQENTNFRRTYDGESQAVEISVTYSGSIITPDDKNLTIAYTGISTDGKTYNASTAPTKAGAYVVSAVYRHYDEENTLIALGANAKTLLVLPAQTQTVVDDAVITKGDSVKLDDLIHITTDVANASPEKTIITARVATNGGFSQIGWNAIEGNVNIDFPAWVDAILAEQVPEIAGGVTVAQLSSVITDKLTELIGKLELGDELTQTLKDMLSQVNGVLSKLPANATVTFENTTGKTFYQVGVYLVGAIVTDSNYRTSADYGLVVVQPKMEQVYLNWNYHDENGIWTEELLKKADLYASAYDDAEFLYRNQQATEKITHTFLTIDSTGSIVVSHDASGLSHGAYLEIAYLELKLDGEMTVSNFIARPIVTIANPAKVEFVDDNGTVNHDRKFTYDGQPHGMPVRVTVNYQIVTPAEGELTVTYRGVTTGGQTYNSEQAPTQAGAYTVTAVYASYQGEKLISGGATVGAMVILPAQATISVTGGTVTYDGQPHGVTADASGADYTLISGMANLSGDIDQVGLEAITANVNVDFPAWVDEILAEKYPNAYANGVDAQTLIRKLEQLDQENTWVSKLVEVLKKIPSDVNVTFRNNVSFTEPGAYVFAGIVTDFNYIPAYDTGLLVIEKMDMLFGMWHEVVPYDGKEHSAFVPNDTYGPVTVDYLTMIVDRERNHVNFLLEDDAMYILENVERILGVELPKEISVEKLRQLLGSETIDAFADALVNALETVLAGMEQNGNTDRFYENLRWIQSELKSLPSNGTITINGRKPVDAGRYEFYVFAFSQYYKTKFASAVLFIEPIRVVVDDVANGKTFGAADPELTASVRYLSYEGREDPSRDMSKYTEEYVWGGNYVKYNTSTDSSYSDIVYREVELTQIPDDIKLKYDVVREEGENVGEYAMEVKNASIEQSGNYQLVVVEDDTKFTITAAQITSVQVQDAYYNNGQAVTAQVVVKAGNATLKNTDYTISGNQGVEANGYTLTVTGTGNYTGTVHQTWNILPAEVTITMNDATKKAGQNDPENNPVVTVNKGSLDVTKLGIRVTRENGETVGRYPYTVTYKTSKNYTVTNKVNAVLIIEDDGKTGLYPIHFDPNDPTGTIRPGATVEIDGKAYTLDSNCTAWVENANAKIAQTFVYHSGEDAYHSYPTNMYVWYLTFQNGQQTYAAQRIPELDNYFQYQGTSIRVNFKSNGIRFITSVNQADTNALIAGNLIKTKIMEGFKLTSAGTLFKWGSLSGTTLQNNSTTASSLVYGIDGESGFRVFQKNGDRDWFTGMLTDLGTDRNILNKDLVSRPYAVLERNGETLTIYGGTIQRSIYYVAKQNENWMPGTPYNDYIKSIIEAVEKNG